MNSHKLNVTTTDRSNDSEVGRDISSKTVTAVVRTSVGENVPSGRDR